jgi:anti-sigma factor RsiW
VAALVYQRDKHLIDLYVWPAAGDSPRPPTTAEAQGYNIVHWREGGMALWAVSDLEPAQLRQFVEDWRRLP